MHWVTLFPVTFHIHTRTHLSAIWVLPAYSCKLFFLNTEHCNDSTYVSSTLCIFKVQLTSPLSFRSIYFSSSGSTGSMLLCILYSFMTLLPNAVCCSELFSVNLLCLWYGERRGGEVLYCAGDGCFPVLQHSVAEKEPVWKLNCPAEAWAL